MGTKRRQPREETHRQSWPAAATKLSLWVARARSTENELTCPDRGRSGEGEGKRRSCTPKELYDRSE